MILVVGVLENLLHGFFAHFDDLFDTSFEYKIFSRQRMIGIKGSMSVGNGSDNVEDRVVGIFFDVAINLHSHFDLFGELVERFGKDEIGVEFAERLGRGDLDAESVADFFSPPAPLREV